MRDTGPSLVVRAMADNTFALRFAGTHVSPSTVRLRDLYDVLHAFESAISITSHQQLGGPQVDLHLVNIREGSTECWLSVNTAGYKAAALCAEAIAARNLSHLPAKARDNLLAIQTKARIKDWTLSIFDGNGMAPAEIGPDTEFVTDAIVTGRSSLTGWVNRVGGTERPTAQIILADFRRFTAEIAGTDLAAELGRLLYSSVTFDGEAQWATPDWRLVDFKIIGIAGVNQDLELLATLQRLAEIAGDSWDDVDPDEYVANLRSEEL
jgi:hypothetical protein